MCIVIDPERPPKSVELRRMSNQISDIWKEVGLELSLEKHELDTIELNHPHHNEKASLDMLFKWKSVNDRASLKTLNQAIIQCRTGKGMYQFSTNNYAYSC